jgi:intraflagellar transport protein 122
MMCRCLDVSAERDKLAVVDEAGSLHVYHLESGRLLWSTEGATSAVWNTHFNDMLAYSAGSHLCTRTADFPVHRQKLQVLLALHQ